MPEVVIPALDLGELGAEIDAAFQDGDTPALEGDATVASDEVVADESDESGEESTPAAEAGDDDFETRYQERFEQEYAARSRKDFGKLRSGLDRQISQAKSELKLASFASEEAETFAQVLLSNLREYDPELADRLSGGRTQYRAEKVQERQREVQDRDAIVAARESYYSKFDGENLPYVDPNDRFLLAAFEADDVEGEKARLNELLEKAGWQGGKPPASLKPKVQAPARNEKGQFVQQRVEQTKSRERQRGPIPVPTKGAPVADRVPLEQDARERYFKQSLSQLLG